MSWTLDEIRAMTIELMKAHKQWIPVFSGKLPAEKPDGTVEKHIDPVAVNNKREL